MKFRQIDESLDFIMTGNIVGLKASVLSDSLEDRVERAKKVVRDDVTFLPLMAIATQPEQKIDGLKPGFPAQIILERTIPAGIADTTLRQEWRRIKSFLPNGPYSTIKPVQREAIWTNLLEGMHFREANVLTMIKDQTLLEEYPGLGNVLVALGLTIKGVNPKKLNTPEIPPTTTLAPVAKKALQTNIDIESASSKASAIVAADIVVSTKPAVAPKTPLWLPAGGALKGGTLLDAALAASQAVKPVETKPETKKKASKAKAKASTKKTTVKKKVGKITNIEMIQPSKGKFAFEYKDESGNIIKTEPIKPKVETDPSVLTEEEFNEISVKSASLQEERNEKMNVIIEEAEMFKFLAEWKEHTTKVLKDLRDEQLNRRKAKE